MKHNNLVTDNLCQLSNKKISEIITKINNYKKDFKHQNGITTLQSKTWSSLLEEKVFGDKPPKWIEYKLIYVGEENIIILIKINNYKKDFKQLVKSIKDDMDICKYDLLSLIMNQSLEEIPETPSETGDMLLSIRKLVDLSVIIRKLSMTKM